MQNRFKNHTRILTSVNFLLSAIILFLTTGLHGQTTFSKEFAPQEGLIKEVEKPFRNEICLNGEWRFKPVFLRADSSPEQIKSPVLPDDSDWEQTPVKVPSPWNVNGFTNGLGGDFRTYPSYPEAWEHVNSGWLKKKIKVPSGWSGHRIILHFEAVAGYAKVFVNGNPAGENLDAFLPFNFDITEFAKAGENLEILVWLAHGNLFDDPGKYGRRNYVAGSFWGKHIVGIWQDVYLQKLPEIYVSDTYIKPWVDKDELEIEVTINNTTSKAVKIDLHAQIKRWINLNGKSVIEIPEVNWRLEETALRIKRNKITLEPGTERTFSLKTKVNGKLDLWSPGSPNLYGLVLSVNQKKETIDKKYTRFGWRQFKIEGTQLILNDRPIQIKGDSWHFMGVPQMTRRYAYAWYQMLLDANGNGLRLHAQVFPRFYLEMADEMGICILDETAIWSSDGGPKIDSDLYWKACRNHVKRLVLRDRNYPSVFGWSVCNETLPVTKHVFNAPEELIARNVSEINEWIKIARENDPTRSWISGDGETQAETDLPTVIGHYGGTAELERWSSEGKPWGIGETGMGYYGTPAQIAKINGDRAYESQQGRMEGLAGEAFDLIRIQRDHDASYTSIFNLAWYGLKPLPLGLQDVTREPELSDGIFFENFRDGKPGYQPERIGPWSSTFNPGYDPTLPLYLTWPLFDAVKAAFSDSYREIDNRWKQPKDNTVLASQIKQRQSIVWLSSMTDAPNKKNFENLGVRFERLSSNGNQLIIIDGSNPPKISEQLLKDMKASVQEGSIVLFWSATANSKKLIEQLTNSHIDFHERNATSYLVRGEHPMLNEQSNSSFYFSEMTKKPISTTTFSGSWVEESQLLLEASNTDWQKWNYNPEAIKTVRVFKDELASKPEGNVMVRQANGQGEILVSTIDLFKVGNQARFMVRQMIAGLGGPFEGTGMKMPKALNHSGIVNNANFYGSVKNDSREIELVFTYTPLTEEEFMKIKVGTLTKGIYWDVLSADSTGVFNFLNSNLKHKKYASAYLSFWVYSPRSLTDLLIEPDMPRLDMHIGADDALAFSVNGKLIKEYIRESGFVKDELVYEGVPLEKGWNHILIKVGQSTGDWKCQVSFSSTKPQFLKELKSVVDR